MAKSKIVKKRNPSKDLSKKPSKSIVKKKKYQATPNGRKGGRMTNKRRDELLEDGQDLVEDGTFSQYSELALCERWKCSRSGVRSIKSILFVNSKDNILLRAARWQGMYDRLERNMANILDKSEKIRMCTNSQCYKDLGYGWEGEAKKCPKCKHPTKVDHQTQVFMSSKIPDLMDRATDFLERFKLKDKVADKVDLTADITHKQLVINYNVPKGEKVVDAK